MCVSSLISNKHLSSFFHKFPCKGMDSLFSHIGCSPGEQCTLCLVFYPEWHKLKRESVSRWAGSFDQDSLWERCNQKRSSNSREDYSLWGWTYNLIRWGGAGDVTLDLSSFTSDSVLNWITGDDGGPWERHDKAEKGDYLYTPEMLRG